MTIVTRHVTQAHLDEWVKGSGVSEAIARLNLESLKDPKEIARRLKWKAYTGPPGWWASGIDPCTGQRRSFGQFKPNEPIQFPTGDFAKYITGPKGSSTEAFFACTGDAAYWPNILDNFTELVALTEGFKKAVSGLTAGIPTVAIAGVWNGQVDKKKLIPDLELLAVPGRPLCLIFDSDVLVKAEVQQALIHLGRLLKKAGCIVTVAQLPAETKGMDDFIVAHGSEEFKRLVNDAIPYEQWLKELEKQVAAKLPDQATRTAKVPPADEVGKQLAEDYRDQLAFNNETACWMRYEADYPGVWSTETDDLIESLIDQALESKGISGYGSSSYVTNVMKAMKRRLLVRKWQERSPKELLPYQNGVLEVQTGKMLHHAPGYRFTWSLPRTHNPLANDWQPISDWMDAVTGGNGGVKKILLCWLNAVLKGRSDLQIFLHLTGPGGTGKGTFMRLCVALIGDRNNHSSSLHDWNNNRFETANAYHKRLITFPDEDKYSGGLGRFKSLTGGDHLRGEEKGKKAFQYVFDGMAMLASNYPIFAGDSSSGMARRCLMLPFVQQVTKGRRRNLEQEFAPYLDALTNYVLSIPDEEVTATLLQLSDESPEVIEQTWEYRMRTDSIAAWLNECVIHDPSAMEQVGADKDDTNTLFGSYSQYCQRTGSRAKGLREFSPSLEDLCNHILQWADVAKIAPRNRKFFKGLRLRQSGKDDAIPNPIEALSTSNDTGQPVTSYGFGYGSEPLQNKECYGCYGSNKNHEKSDNLQKTDNNSESVLKKDSSTRNTRKLEPESSNGGTLSRNIPTTPPPVTPVTPVPILQVGERCRYVGPEGAMAVTCRGKSMDVLEVRWRDGVMEARVKAEAWAVDYWVSCQSLRRDRRV